MAEGWVAKRLTGDGNVVAYNDYFGKDPLLHRQSPAEEKPGTAEEPRED
ncbi:hypothetical protein [Edaphobacter aggregans]|nr:hypothetical protein [Edaphobacter aggregans]